MYQVNVNPINGKRYYYSYVDMNGNIECDDLPPYQDINKARACWWDDEKWNFDEGRYAEILAEIEAQKEAAQAEKDRLSSIPSNEELNEMLLTSMVAIAEITSFIDTTVEPLTDLAALLKGGKDNG